MTISKTRASADEDLGHEHVLERAQRREVALRGGPELQGARQARLRGRATRTSSRGPAPARRDGAERASAGAIAASRRR